MGESWERAVGGRPSIVDGLYAEHQRTDGPAHIPATNVSSLIDHERRLLRYYERDFPAIAAPMTTASDVTVPTAGQMSELMAQATTDATE